MMQRCVKFTKHPISSLMEGENCWFRSGLCANWSSMPPLLVNWLYQILQKKKNKPKTMMYPAIGKSSTVKLFKFPFLSYKLKVVWVCQRADFIPFPEDHVLTSISLSVPVYLCPKKPLRCLKFWAHNIVVKNCIFLSRCFTLYTFMISPFNNFHLHKAITVFQNSW